MFAEWREIRCKEGEVNEQGQASACELSLKEHENDESPRVVPFNTCVDVSVLQSFWTSVL